MKAFCALPLAVLLALFFSGPCLAMMSVAQVSKERAREMGLNVQARAAGPEAVWVGLSFKTEGALKGFRPEHYSRVELRFMDGKQSLLQGGQSLVTAALQMEQPRPGQVVVGFTASRASVHRMSLMVVVGSGLMPGGGYELALKDFIDLEALDRREPEQEAGETAPPEGGPPASTAGPEER